MTPLFHRVQLLCLIVLAFGVLSQLDLDLFASHPDVIYIGDSMIANWPAVPGVLNAGAGGETSGDVLSRWRAQYRGQTYRFAVVWMGFNDLRADVSPERFHDNYRELLWGLTMRHVKTAYIVGIGPFDAKYGISAERLRATNDWLRTLAASCVPGLQCVYADTYDLLRDPATGKLAAQYDSGDGLHPNAAAYRRIEESYFSNTR